MGKSKYIYTNLVAYVAYVGAQKGKLAWQDLFGAFLQKKLTDIKIKINVCESNPTAFIWSRLGVTGINIFRS